MFAAHRRSHLALWVGAVALLAVLFLAGIGVAPLIDRDEPAYAEAAREMLAGGEWVVTRYNDQPWIDKPPLVFWAAMVSYLARGVNETAARLPVALFGIGGVLAAYWLGRRLRSPRAGALSAAVLASSLLYLGLSRAVLLDVPFAACLTLAIAALVASLQQPQRARWPLLGGAALGLAVLAKSPAAVVLFALILAAAAIPRGSPARVHPLRWGLAILACLAVVAPWYAAMAARFPHTFLSQFLLAGNLGRFVHAEHSRSTAPYYYLPIIIVGFLPWTALLPGAVRAAWRERGAGSIPLLWAALTFIFFSVAQSKLPGYILPAFPALAVMVGLDLDRRIENRYDDTIYHSIGWAAGLTLLFAAAGLIYAIVKQPQYVLGAAVLAALAGLPLALAMWRQGRAGAAAAWAAALVTIIAAIAGYGLLPAAAKGNTTASLARVIIADGPPRRVYLINAKLLDYPSLLFYLRHAVIPLSPVCRPSSDPADVFVVEGHLPPYWYAQHAPRPVAAEGRLCVWRPLPAAARSPGLRDNALIRHPKHPRPGRHEL
jgi:4-amino-4-deoxy-L-arabinose transferase-like glycosyltransferase